MDVDSTQEDAVSELATARSLYEWARKLHQPARDKELPAARKRLELAEGEDKKRKPPAERLQSALSRVDHRTRQAQAAKDALSEAQQALEVLEAECLHQEALLVKDQEELQVAQSLHQAWGPAARDGPGAPSHTQPAQGTAPATGQAEHQKDLLNRLLQALPPGQGPGILKELAGTLGFPPTQGAAQEGGATQAPPLVGQPEYSAKKAPKQARIKSQGPYGRSDEEPPGAGARSASATGEQDGPRPGCPAGGAAEDEAEQL